MAPYDMDTLREHFFVFDPQDITIDDFESSGYILDIGGGGEGIIGILKGDAVVAIDLRKQELEEAAAGPLKIVMDARDLQFLDESFNTATAFFSLMYLKETVDYEQVFREAFRVLRPGGRFLIWDVAVPTQPDGEKEGYLVLLKVNVKGEEIETGYGLKWPEEKHDVTFYLDRARGSGFRVVEQREEGPMFFLHLVKPESSD